MRNKLSYSEAGKLGAAASRITSARQKQERIENYLLCPKLCKKCQTPLPYDKKCNDFCSKSCSAQHNNRGVRRHGCREFENCVQCGVSLIGRAGKVYCSSACQAAHRKEDIDGKILSDPNLVHPRRLKKFLIETRGYECESCHNTQWMQQPIALELEHIDGHSDNNDFSNLLLLCPNCHALTPTYKGKNAGNGRAKRRERYRQGKSY